MLLKGIQNTPNMFPKDLKKALKSYPLGCPERVWDPKKTLKSDPLGYPGAGLGPKSTKGPLFVRNWSPKGAPNGAIWVLINQ